MRDPTSTENPIVGAWRLIAFTETNQRTGDITYPFGKDARAAVIYTRDGHVATLFTTENRQPPAAAQATDEEAAALYRSMIAFAGRYETRDRKLIYHPEISWNETWNGTVQERDFSVSQDRLTVTSVPAISALAGAMTVFALSWRRA